MLVIVNIVLSLILVVLLVFRRVYIVVGICVLLLRQLVHLRINQTYVRVLQLLQLVFNTAGLVVLLLKHHCFAHQRLLQLSWLWIESIVVSPLFAHV